MTVGEYYDREGAERLLRGLREGVLLAQGPMGSALMEIGGADVPAAFWNVAEPQEVARIHMLYERAGAEVMVTNTFQASGPALQRDGISQGVGEVNRAAADCALSAHGLAVLGSIGPCGLDWEGEDDEAWSAASASYREQASALLAANCSGILLETFTSLRDLSPALCGAMEAADGMPVLCSVVIDARGRLLHDDASIEEAIGYMEERGASAVGVNCCSLAEANAVVSRIAASSHVPFMIRPNAGIPAIGNDGLPSWSEDAEAFARACLVWRDAGASMVGSCCGASARTTCAMAAALDKFEGA